MLRPLLVAVTLSCLSRAVIAGQSSLIPETTAAKHGLTRPWFNQMDLARGQARVNAVILYRGVLYMQSDRAMVHAIDAETGKTLWARQVGRPDRYSLAPAANENLLVVPNGSRLYVANRHNGNLLLDREVDGVPGAGAAASAERAYVPTLSGMVLAYRLDELTAAPPSANVSKEEATTEEPPADEKQQLRIRVRQELLRPVWCQSPGRVLTPPLLTRETADDDYLAWCTDRGYLNVTQLGRKPDSPFATRFRLATESQVLCAPAYLPPDPEVPADSGVIYVASQNGFVHAIQEKNGDPLWRFSTGESIEKSPVVIGERLYVATLHGGMYCLEAKTGKSIWRTPDARQFVSASASRLYTIDRLGNLLVLDVDNGDHLDVMPLENVSIRLCNKDTDRLYLADENGLIQCLHEIAQSEPLMHNEARRQAAKAQGDSGSKQEAVESVKPVKKEPIAPRETAPKKLAERKATAPAKPAAPIEGAAKKLPAAERRADKDR